MTNNTDVSPNQIEASTSHGISIPNSDNIDFGTGNFSLSFKGNISEGMFKGLNPPVITQDNCVTVVVTTKRPPRWKFWKPAVQFYLDGEAVPWWVKGLLLRWWLRGHYKRIEKWMAKGTVKQKEKSPAD